MRVFSARLFVTHIRPAFRGRILLIFLLLMLMAGSRASSQTASATATTSGRLIRLGYLSSMLAEVDRNDAKVALRVWTEHLSQEEGLKWDTASEIYDSLDEMLKAVQERKIDMISISALDYLRIREKVPLIPEICSAWSDSPFGVELLFVRKDSGISTLADLKSKTLIIERLATGGLPQIWIDTLLHRQGLPSHEQFFGPVKLVDKGSAAVMPVFFKQAVACIVRETSYQTMVEMNPQIGNSLKVVEQSPKFLRSLALFRADYPEADRKQLNRSAVKLHKSVKGQQILTLFKTEKIIPYEPAFLKTTEALLAEYQALKAKKSN